MTLEDRNRWERKHRTAGSDDAEASVSQLPAARDGDIALDLACGQGRNSAGLAALGYRVVAVDIARSALTRTRDRVQSSANPWLCVHSDLDHWPFGTSVFDAIVQVAFLDRRLFPAMKAALKPGGFLLIDTFLRTDRPNTSGPCNPAFLLEPGELPHVFEGWDHLSYEETIVATKRARLLTRKPRGPLVHAHAGRPRPR